jgi:hypothetical protein
MGSLITHVRPYFRWATAFHRAEDPPTRLKILRNELASLNASETDPHIKKRLSRIVQPQSSEGISK